MTALRMRLATAFTAVAVLATSFVPVFAAPMRLDLASPPATSDVTKVQYHGHHGPPRHYRGHDRRGYYNGHRGYSYHRPGYRYHNGYWFPLAAFGAGAIIGGAIASQPRAHSSNHYQWCASRYRTYRASDNTYVSSPGVRRTCVSP
ncbi:BA14K family protein [Neorhizobium sp. NCHU2750]|uniref:BA14K family protein n=1 Tax=Neorhizobium sp. NCHU2750 TaxID=1825976 RepID=UPI000E730A35|nr:BA14K family protein [Neorhizobium sp. NCHU2750]